MLVNGLDFLVTTSHNLRFLTQQYLPRRTADILSQGINDVISFYNSRDFKVTTALMNKKFERLPPLLPGINLNTTTEKERVDDIERMIRMIKERFRVIHSTLPFHRLLARMIVQLGEFCFFG